MEEKTMTPDLFGKWYVYGYNPSEKPVLKAPETTLEISRQTKAGCLARCELSGWAEPVDIEMVAGSTGVWQTKEGGSFGFLDLRWNCIEQGDEDPAVLVGQVTDQNGDAVPPHDYFVAVRSRRTHRLPKQTMYHFQGAYSTLFEENPPSIKWSDNDSQGIHLDLRTDVTQAIRIGSSVYDLTSPPTPYKGGLKILGKRRGVDEVVTVDEVALWILPVAEPGQSDCLLAIGLNAYHVVTASGVNPLCQSPLHLC
jgi:hypothetical protein